MVRVSAGNGAPTGTPYKATPPPAYQPAMAPTTPAQHIQPPAIPQPQPPEQVVQYQDVTAPTGPTTSCTACDAIVPQAQLAQHIRKHYDPRDPNYIGPDPQAA